MVLQCHFPAGGREGCAHAQLADPPPAGRHVLESVPVQDGTRYTGTAYPCPSRGVYSGIRVSRSSNGSQGYTHWLILSVGVGVISEARFVISNQLPQPTFGEDKLMKVRKALSTPAVRMVTVSWVFVGNSCHPYAIDTGYAARTA